MLRKELVLRVVGLSYNPQSVFVILLYLPNLGYNTPHIHFRLHLFPPSYLDEVVYEIDAPPFHAFLESFAT